MNTMQSNPNFRAGGFYRPNTDEITTGPQSIVHELGHAVDFQGKQNMSGKNNYSRVLKNPKFKQAFQIGLKRFTSAGQKQYDYNDNSTWSSNLAKRLKMSNYCTANEKELWAELYTALTTGTCNSYNTIVKYFPEAIEVGKELLKTIRNENSASRHNTPTRTIINTLA